MFYTDSDLKHSSKTKLMKILKHFIFGLLISSGLIFSCQPAKKEKADTTVTENTPTIVTQDNFPQAYTNMRLAAVLKKTGDVNKFFKMPVPSSVPAEQFVVRMNADPGVVQIIGFGTFKKKNRAARMGRNPKTGEPMQINASTSVGFSPSAAFKKSLN